MVKLTYRETSDVYVYIYDLLTHSSKYIVPSTQVICHRTVGAEVPIGEELLSSTATKIHVITRTPNPPQQQIQDLLDRCSRRNSEERPGINTVAEDLKAILSAAVAITDAPPTTNDGSCGATKDVTSRSTSAPSKPPRAALTPPG